MLIWAEQGAERNWKEVLVVGASLFVGGHNSAHSHLRLNLILIICSLYRASRTPWFRQVLGLASIKLTISLSRFPQHHFEPITH